MNKEYKSWPIGKVPKEFQRPELDMVKEAGYDWDDAWDVVHMFEQKMADFAGCKYGVAIDNCTDAVFLSLKWMKKKGLDLGKDIIIPRHSYCSIPMAVKLAGYNLKFETIEWSGYYQLKPYPVYDAAVRFRKNMFVGDKDGEYSYHCISFQLKKRLPIGKGGMILTNDKEAVEWFKLMRYEGRNLDVYYPEDNFGEIGWNMYMTPEDAARGIMLMDQLPDENEDTGNWKTYSDLKKQEVFKNG